ncbi:RluA family pseudouridine synthase [Tenacibaculum geojense]|uniref:Pseudouridine synthase n=1 Tax=Tenacibaculum geojense TaxID=915352 RepID=A0ABW3JNV4_9FLAO
MDKLIDFKTNISNLEIPKTINYPYNYTPYKIAQVASEELQCYLESEIVFKHNFGIKNNNENALGKMFGVLVVQNSKGKIGYLAAFSGKIDNSQVHNYFVPPVSNILSDYNFYRKSEDKISDITNQIETITNNPEYIKVKAEFENLTNIHEQILASEKIKIQQKRQIRRSNYKKKKQLIDRKELKKLQQEMNQQKLNEDFFLNEYKIYLDQKIKPIKEAYDFYNQPLDKVLSKRKKLSAKAQEDIFDSYNFINAKKEEKSLKDIFSQHKTNIPAGAGDCCAPKLFQYAFKNNLSPIALAEFWWGKPLKTSIRKHKNYYPACVGKCKPILSHMLSNTNVSNNPLTNKLSMKIDLDIIYEDDVLLVINKPEEFLTVSGTEIENSIHSIVRQKYPTATGPLIVHRLDMSTSGVLLIAKEKSIHKALQEQFINRSVKKRYLAELDGILEKNEGTISLPLKVDFHNRPQQMVCFKQGKNATTHFKVLSVKNNKTRLYLYPITGRTHQLRMHTAHPLGLNTPIIGDDLYGKRANRLHLHAESLTCKHPVTGKTMNFSAPCNF